MAHIYKDSFFNYIDISSSRSAKNFIHDVTLPLQVNSILDIGCGRGAWIAEWHKNGKSVFGVDGDYVNVENLLVEKEFFKHQDISESFDLNKKFDMVQCLEVAEHLQEADADTLVENSSYGVNADYGIGGTAGNNGSQGFVFIKRVA